MIVYEQQLQVLRKLLKREDVEILTDHGPAVLGFTGNEFILDYMLSIDPIEVDRDDIMNIIDRHFYLEAKAKVTDIGWLENKIKEVEHQKKCWLNSECFGG
jgi:hypothetical protein